MTATPLDWTLTGHELWATTQTTLWLLRYGPQNVHEAESPKAPSKILPQGYKNVCSISLNLLLKPINVVYPPVSQLLIIKLITIAHFFLCCFNSLPFTLLTLAYVLTSNYNYFLLCKKLWKQTYGNLDQAFLKQVNNLQKVFFLQQIS